MAPRKDSFGGSGHFKFVVSVHFSVRLVYLSDFKHELEHPLEYELFSLKSQVQIKSFKQRCNIDKHG